MESRWLLKGLVESVFVVGSILLALALDQWAQEREYQEIAKQSLGIFATEIVANKARIEDGLPYHRGIHEVVAQMTVEGGTDPELRSIMEGVEIPVLLNTAWETALATGSLTHMDVEVVSALSLTYSIQERFATSLRSSRPDHSVRDGLSSAEVQGRLEEAEDYLADLSRGESELLAVYDQALAMIRGQLPEAGQPRGGTPALMGGAGSP